VGAPYSVTVKRDGASDTIGRPRHSRAVVVLSAVLLLAAIVAAVGSFGARRSSSLDEAEEYLRVPRRLANLAADHDDRRGLAEVLNAGKHMAEREAAMKKAAKVQEQHQREERYGRRKVAHKKWSKEMVAEERAKDMNARDHRQMMKSETMVPWVRWPGSSDTGDSFESARKQQLLQMPMLMKSDVNDNAAKLLPLNAIMNRLKVDSALHKGLVTDTQLAMADETSRSKRTPIFSHQLKLDCKPFC